jgi:hypothetical protein
VSQGLLAWPRRWRYARQDARVDEWKDAWRAGAQARWSGAPVHHNPHDERSPRRSAWAAGWQWASRQPDRRAGREVRFAHPSRRISDSSAVMMRRGAVGLSVLTMLGWLWRARGRQRT